MIKTVLFLSLLVISDTGFGQRTLLMLQKSNHHKNIYYKPGDRLSFRLNGSREKITGEILDFKDSLIVFRGFEVTIAEIKCLYIDEKTRWWLRYKIEQLCFITGGGYLLLDVVNGGKLNEGTLVITGSLIGAGIMARILIGNRIKIRGRTKLRVVRL